LICLFLLNFYNLKQKGDFGEKDRGLVSLLFIPNGLISQRLPAAAWDFYILFYFV